MAEEVGVEATRRFLSPSLVLKTRHPTGGVALPVLLRLNTQRAMHISTGQKHTHVPLPTG